MTDNPNRRIDIKFSGLLDRVIKELDENIEINVSPALITKWIAKHEQFKKILEDVEEKLEEILK